MVNYKSLLVQNSHNHVEIIKSLDEVRKYIIKNKLILVGGLAIDFAMRLKGEELYDENDVPDYDFYSKNHYQDAINLGNILCKIGVPNISIINAFHVTTVKVRVNFTPVADITYCPAVIFDSLDTLQYKGIRVLHPHQQIIDQHITFAYPYRNPQWGGNVTRWNKDILRHEDLKRLYPIAGDEKKLSNKIIEFDKTLIEGCCLSGYVAHAALDNKFRVVGDEIHAEVYEHELMVYTNTFDDTVKKWESLISAKATIVNSFLGRLPRHAKITKGISYIIVENHKDYISAFGPLIADENYTANFSTTEMKELKDGRSFWIASPHLIKLYYLHQGNYSAYSELDKFDFDRGFPVSYYGTENVPEMFEILAREFDDEELKSMRPRNLYPKEECNVTGEFDYSSPYFAIDGQPHKKQSARRKSKKSPAKREKSPAKREKSPAKRERNKK